MYPLIPPGSLHCPCRSCPLTSMPPLTPSLTSTAYCFSESSGRGPGTWFSEFGCVRCFLGSHRDCAVFSKNTNKALIPSLCRFPAPKEAGTSHEGLPQSSLPGGSGEKQPQSKAAFSPLLPSSVPRGCNGRMEYFFVLSRQR